MMLKYKNATALKKKITTKKKNIVQNLRKEENMETTHCCRGWPNINNLYMQEITVDGTMIMALH